jgi:hypothetical protein
MKITGITMNEIIVNSISKTQAVALKHFLSNVYDGIDISLKVNKNVRFSELDDNTGVVAILRNPLDAITDQYYGLLETATSTSMKPDANFLIQNYIESVNKQVSYKEIVLFLTYDFVKTLSKENSSYEENKAKLKKAIKEKFALNTTKDFNIMESRKVETEQFKNEIGNLKDFSVDENTVNSIKAKIVEDALYVDAMIAYNSAISLTQL